MSSRPLVALVALGLLAAGCGYSTRVVVEKRPRAPVLMYSCCIPATRHRLYHSGDIVTLDWMRSHGGQGRDKGAETLKARLDGPYRDVVHAKAGTFGAVQATGRPINVAPGTAAPVSHIRIPADAKPGLYKVTTTDVEGAGSIVTKTIIRVVRAGG